MPPPDLAPALQAALRRTAEGMARHAATTPVTALGEERHLRPAFAAALRGALDEALAGTGAEIEVAAAHPLGLEDWPSGAGAAIALTPVASGGARGRPALIELRWVGAAGSLADGVWDVSRLALAVALGAASAAFLVAGAPARSWRPPSDGLELFERGTLRLEHLRAAPYRVRWVRWAQEGRPQPARLPTAVAVQPFATVPMTLAGDSWALRCVRIVPGGDGDLAEVAPLPVR